MKLVHFILLSMLFCLPQAMATLRFNTAVYSPKYGLGRVISTHPLIVNFDWPAFKQVNLSGDDLNSLEEEAESYPYKNIQLKAGMDWEAGARRNGTIVAVFSKGSIHVSFPDSQGEEQLVYNPASNAPIPEAVQKKAKPTFEASDSEENDPKTERSKKAIEEKRKELERAEADYKDRIINIKTNAQSFAAEKHRPYIRYSSDHFKNMEDLMDAIGWEAGQTPNAVIDLIYDADRTSPYFLDVLKMDTYISLIHNMKVGEPGVNIYITNLEIGEKENLSQPLTQFSVCERLFERFH